MIKNNLTLLICCVAVIATSTFATAQTGTYYTVQDLEFWSSVEFKYKYSKKWSFSLEEQLRLRDNASNVDIYFTELGLNYKLNKHFNAGFNGRFIYDNDDVGKIQGYENHFRWNADLSYSHSAGDFDFDYRLRYQSKNELGISELDGDIPRNVFRFKYGVDYNFKSWKLDPEFSAEIFNEVQPDNEFDKIRFTLGTSYKTKNYGDFGAFFRMEKELTGLYPKTTNIVGLKYKYTLKRKNDES